MNEKKKVHIGSLAARLADLEWNTQRLPEYHMYITKLSYQPKAKHIRKDNSFQFKDRYSQSTLSGESHCETWVPCSGIWPQPGIATVVATSHPACPRLAVGDLGPSSKKKTLMSTIANVNRRFNENKTFYKPQYTIRNIINAIKYPSDRLVEIMQPFSI